MGVACARGYRRWLVTIAMMVPVGVATLVMLMIALQATWDTSSPGTTVFMVAACGVMMGAGSGLVARMTRGWVRRTSDEKRRRWRIQQQAALALCRIYSESEHCGRTYCDGNPPERIGRVKDGWLRLIASHEEMRALSSNELLTRFQQEKVFWRQVEIGRALAAAGDRGAIPALEPWLKHPDRHLRGNAAFVVGRLGDPRGFQIIADILTDRSERPEGQGIPGGRWSVQRQIRADRYYAAHLVGDLKDPRGVELLIPLLTDDDVEDIVPWALGMIGDRRAIEPLIQRLEQNDPSTRVLAIDALERLNAREALPRLRELLRDTRRSNFGDRVTVADATKRAIAVIAQGR